MARSKNIDQTYLLTQQYNDGANLSARARLHILFSTNPQRWPHWVFDRVTDPLTALPPDARVLELGCGPGWLWAENLDRIPGGWRVTLSDFSDGMLNEARQNLRESGRAFDFRLVDAQLIPFEDAAFDAVIANHMLYHVPDRPRALSEIRRVIKPGGRFFAATNGKNHLREMYEIEQRFDPEGDYWDGFSVADGFMLENGADQLAAWFDPVTLIRFDNNLIVTEIDPLVDYYRSGPAQKFLVGDKLNTLRAFLREEMAATGVIRITKDSGLFIAQRQ